jgi:hypothetical protein
MTDAGTTASEPEQRMSALKQANQVRQTRAALKRRIAFGEVSVAEVILDYPEAARRLTVAELLMSQRRWGSTRCRKFLERNEISEIKLLGELTKRQQKLLAGQLECCATSATSDVAADAAAEFCDITPRARDLVYA